MVKQRRQDTEKQIRQETCRVNTSVSCSRGGHGPQQTERHSDVLVGGCVQEAPSPTFISTPHESRQALGWLVGELDVLIPKFI